MMPMASRSLSLLCLLAVSTPALAQNRPVTPPGRPPAATPPRTTAQAPDRTIAPAPGAPGAQTNRPKPTCEEVKRNARYGIYFDKVEIEKLVQTVADATCKTFILPENVRGKISIVGPENGRVEVTGDQFYAAFLASLDANGLAVYQHGRFMKVVDKRSAKQSPIPTITGSEADYTFNEQMVTRIFKIKNVEIEPLRGVLSQLVSKEGDCIPYAPDTLICNDVGSNLHRLEKIIDQLDTKASTDEVAIIQVQYAAAADVAATIQKIFESKTARPGTRPGSATVRRGATPGQAAAQAQPAASVGGVEDGAGGPVTVSQIIPDERTNKLIIVASPAAFDRINQLIREIDIPISGEGRINVHYLENASAEDIASTLQSLAQGNSSSSGRPNRPPTPQGQAGAAQGATTAELFAGEVKISADKATNSLVIIASQSDYRNLQRVIEKLDIPRRQVFVEAVIMEVNLDRNAEFGLSFHHGIPLNTADGVVPALIGTNYAGSGVPPSFSLGNLASFGGFLAGLQGPVIPALSKLGVNIPAFGVVLHALQQSSDVNVLSTPHLLTSDNEEAEITVGQNVPFQAGFNPTGASSLLGAGAGGAASLLGGGLSSLYAPINRQNVELKLTIKPQIGGGESDLIRLVISEQTEEIASQDPVLGPTTSKRSAKTTVVARNQETVVIGGIMQDRTIESVSKVPILGDVPLIGHLFRDSTRRKVKTNLLLFLTPYIINDQGDFRAIFERKMQERQQFVEQFYGQVPGYDMAVDFSRKAGPLARIHQTALREEAKLENGGPGAPGEQLIGPGGSPGTVRSTTRPAEAAPGDASEAPVAAPPEEAVPPPVEDKQQLEVRPPPIDEYDQR
ncbi:MAG: type II secretion system secretin GspD [Myxococcota bacterium]|nr:type II secretion system secretin GspD [Myxococcota bacterium]